MSKYICDHAYMCKQNPKATSKVDCCCGRNPHNFNHEECNGFNCPHANGEWVKCVPTHIPNPILTCKA